MIAQEEARSIIVDRLLASPLARHLGLLLEALEPGQVRMRLPFSVSAVTDASTLHGGAIATLVDVAAVAAAVSAAKTAPGAGATSSLSISYLSPARGCDLVATATSLRAGARQHVARVEVHDSSEQLIAAAIVTVVLS